MQFYSHDDRIHSLCIFPESPQDNEQLRKYCDVLSIGGWVIIYTMHGHNEISIDVD